jgi:hypothetical protein
MGVFGLYQQTIKSNIGPNNSETVYINLGRTLMVVMSVTTPGEIANKFYKYFQSECNKTPPDVMQFPFLLCSHTHVVASVNVDCGQKNMLDWRLLTVLL